MTGDFPNPGIEPMSHELAEGFFSTEPPMEFGWYKYWPQLQKPTEVHATLMAESEELKSLLTKVRGE